eukprot:g24232.t1
MAAVLRVEQDADLRMLALLKEDLMRIRELSWRTPAVFINVVPLAGPWGAVGSEALSQKLAFVQQKILARLPGAAPRSTTKDTSTAEPLNGPKEQSVPAKFSSVPQSACTSVSSETWVECTGSKHQFASHMTCDMMFLFLHGMPIAL